MSAHTRGHHNPSTRLGGSNFNHQQSSDSEAEYDRLRNLARQEHSRMSECYEKSQQAYHNNNGALAHSLSETAKQHKAAAESYNAQASSFIFRANNSESRVAGDTIDLHGQFVEEAEDILEARIKQARAEHQTHLHVIVGKGIHSPGHVQKIKPRVEQVCRELGLKYRTEENEGRIYVDLTGSDVDYELPGVGQTPGKYQGGYSYGGGGGYPGQQQQQQDGQYGGGDPYGYAPQQQHPQYGGQQQQQQQQFEMEGQGQKQDDPLTACIKGCCVVM